MPRLLPHLPANIPLRSSPGPSGTGNYVLGCRKIILQWNENWISNKGAKDYIKTGRIIKLAEKWPQVEFILKENLGRQASLIGFYTNGKEKIIPLRNKSIEQIEKDFNVLLSNSGKKPINFDLYPVLPGNQDSARGIWSSLHTFKAFQRRD